jgi:hypothetical protein
MKPKSKIERKLSLKKSMISMLNRDVMQSVKGGNGDNESWTLSLITLSFDCTFFGCSLRCTTTDRK